MLTTEQQFQYELIFRRFTKSLRLSLLTMAAAPEQGLEIFSSVFITTMLVVTESIAETFKLDRDHPATNVFKSKAQEQPMEVLKLFKSTIEELAEKLSQNNLKAAEVIINHEKNSYEEFKQQYPALIPIFDSLEESIRKYFK